MMKIGFWDEYLDNWHANYYPEFLRQAIAEYGFDAAVTDAFAYTDAPGGITTEDWCLERNIHRHTDPAAFLDAVDAIMVIGAVMPVFTVKSPYRLCRAESRPLLTKPLHMTCRRASDCSLLHENTIRLSSPLPHSVTVRASPRIGQSMRSRALCRRH